MQSCCLAKETLFGVQLGETLSHVPSNSACGNWLKCHHRDLIDDVVGGKMIGFESHIFD